MARTSPWPTVLGTAALIALPVLAAAQTGSATPQTATTSQHASDTESSTPQQHLDQAKQVLNEIPRASVTGKNASKLNEVRRHFAALEKSYSAKAGKSESAPASPSSASPKSAKSGDWNTHLMALDRALSDLLGAESTAASPSGTPGATGTSGSTSAPASADLDSSVRADLEEFRSHITRFAAAASGTSASGTMSSAAGSTSSAGSMTSSGSTSPTTSSSEPTGSTAGTAGSSIPQSATPQSSASQSTTSQSTTDTSAQGDATVAREHLTKARQSLADLTALPQAQQLQGETRNQVSELIGHFNALITTKEDWRSAYDQVNTTLNALLSSSAASSTPGAAGTSGSTTGGAVGTSGSAASAAIDPAVRSKLEEFQTHLQAFYTAAGGGSAASSSSSSASEMTSAGTASQSSTSGQTTSGTYGSTQTSTTSADVETHIAAIERILRDAGASMSGSASGTASGTAGSTTGSTSGTSGSSTTSPSSSTGSSVTLTPAQIEQIRMHLQQLRQSVRK